jgi:DNA-binding LytR/AlgR family response regulator
MKCIVVEDEPAAQYILKQYIDSCPGLTCHGVFHDAFSAQEYMDEHTVDLLFLDINLPEMSGISFLRSLVHPPLVIFTTAYPQYALDGFDLEIVDFLLKPFSYERFCKAVNKAKESLNHKSAFSFSEKMTVRSDRRIYQINMDDILFIEACGDYVTLQFTDKKLTVHGTLKDWEEKLKNPGFMRVHRTTIINLRKIDHIDGNIIVTGRHKLPLAESCKALLFERMLHPL